MRDSSQTSRWGSADAEIKDPSLENVELKGSPFTALNRSEYSHAMLHQVPGFLPFVLPVRSSAFFQNLSRVFPVLAVANTGS